MLNSFSLILSFQSKKLVQLSTNNTEIYKGQLIEIHLGECQLSKKHPEPISFKLFVS